MQPTYICYAYMVHNYLEKYRLYSKNRYHVINHQKKTKKKATTIMLRVVNRRFQAFHLQHFRIERFKSFHHHYSHTLDLKYE